MVAVSVTAALALGTVPGMQAALAAPQPVPKVHVKLSPQLTHNGLLACAESHHLPEQLAIEISADLGEHGLLDKLGIEETPELLFLLGGHFTEEFYEFWFDCVAPYIHPEPIVLGGGYILLPGFTFSPPSSNPHTTPPTSPSTAPPTSPSSSGPTPPFYTLGG